ncbi:hypothetical protein DE146DRAFT_736951 [Phaeosphaeria sp. MPI-PUGE-AT-0046c]|nr:hypothetical protein DE146DRAFT_736951 [Phaeosphaeria sp. MPI-PUGE-AT-0046c]
MAASLPTIKDLESALQDLDRKFPKAKLEGLAFQLTSNESLGLGDGKAFNVNIPFRTWPPKEKIHDTSALPKCKYPSALQEAFKEVLTAGSKKSDRTTWDTSACWIDIVSLNPADLFFTEFTGKSEEKPYVPLGQLDSIAKAIADVVNSIPESSNIKPVIRILAGADENLTATEYWQKFLYRFENMFWTKESADGPTIPLITQKNATLFVGYYGPTFQPGSPEASSWLETLGGSVESIVQKNEDLIKSHANDPSFDPKKLHLHDQITTFVKDGLPAISWNHGKLLVVNGKVVMTGGGNFWNEYMGQQCDIVDHQAKIKGDAAITAHKYTNYFFEYLNKHVQSDTRSLLRSCTLSSNSPNWTDGVQAPLADFKPSNTGQYPVLTVGRLGDWHGTMAKVPFPVQVIDAIRDVALNVFWHIKPDNEQGKTIAMMDYALRDDSTIAAYASTANIAIKVSNIFSTQKTLPFIVPDINEIFTDLQINPVAWASRYARKYVIERAEKRVCISQQMLVDLLQIDDASFKKAVFGVHDQDHPKDDKAGLNDRLKPITKGSTPWDGAIWPYDLLCAIGWALARIDFNKGDGVYIVLTTDFPRDGKTVTLKNGEKVHKEARKRNWEDRTKVSEFKKRLAVCMKGMAQLRTVLPNWFLLMTAEDRVDEVINKRLHVQRVLNNDGDHYCHNKIVMVDDKLLYIGSDNAYPSYNEEHGVWIDHQDTIKSWKKDYWDGLWDWSSEAKD